MRTAVAETSRAAFHSLSVKDYLQPKEREVMAVFERKAVAEAGKARTEVVWLNHACSTALIGQQAQQRLIA